jgi:hypothetical protein
MTLKSWLPGPRALAAAGMLTVAVPSAAWADVHDLQRGLPLEVEDTLTAQRREMQFQTPARYERDENDDLLTVEPQLQYGFADNFQVEVTYPIKAGDGPRSGSGDVVVAGVYRFLDEEQPGFTSSFLPSMAVKGEFVLPTGINSDGLDTALRFIATKTVTEDETEDRVHLNLAWELDMAAGSNARAHMFTAVIGYSRKVREDTVVLADLVLGQDRQDNQSLVILEGGVLHQLSERLTLAGGLGVGLNDDSPEFRATVGFQFTF